MTEQKPYMVVEENDFDKLEEQARLASEAAKEVTYKEADYNRAVQDAFENGFSQGQREALTTQEERISTSFEKLVLQFDRLISMQAAAEAVQEKETINIALAIVKKIMPRFIEIQGSDEISRLIERALRNNITSKELIIFVHPTVLDDVQNRLIGFIEENGYKGRATFKADPRVPAGDCKLDWGVGGITRIIPNLWSEIETQITSLLNGDTIEDYLNAPIDYEKKIAVTEAEPAFIHTPEEKQEEEKSAADNNADDLTPKESTQDGALKTKE